MGVLLHEDKMGLFTVTIDPGSVSANTTAEQDVTVVGLRIGDFVRLNKPSHTAGLSLGNARVKAADTMSVTFVNSTGSPIDAASETYMGFWYRAERTMSGAVNP